LSTLSPSALCAPSPSTSWAPLVGTFPRASTRPLLNAWQAPPASDSARSLSQPSPRLARTLRRPNPRHAPARNRRPDPFEVSAHVHPLFASLPSSQSHPPELAGAPTTKPLAPRIPHGEVAPPSLTVVCHHRSELRPDRASLKVSSPVGFPFLCPPFSLLCRVVIGGDR
jgi:hypothetical protein